MWHVAFLSQILPQLQLHFLRFVWHDESSGRGVVVVVVVSLLLSLPVRV